jgi:hypothetical protein
MVYRVHCIKRGEVNDHTLGPTFPNEETAKEFAFEYLKSRSEDHVWVADETGKRVASRAEIIAHANATGQNLLPRMK